MYSELDPRHDMQPHLPRILSRDVYFPGQTIIEQNSAGHRAFFIEKGRVEVVVKDGPLTVKVAELGPGEIFGEMALIEHCERSAAVRALENTTVTVITEAELAQKLNSIEDKTISTLMHVFIERLRHSNQSQMTQYRYLAEFQDRMTGLMEKARHGVSEEHRREFRDQAEPLIEQLQELLDKYGMKNRRA